jgi:O-succinylbenzoic acid--CoA ligase
MNADIARDFIERWRNGQSQFDIYTSGSTGEPKKIILEKDKMRWSAANTASVIKPGVPDSLLCCLPCNKVGGLMMLVRSLEWGLQVETIEPVSNPFLEERNTTIVSLTPFQLYHVLNNKASLNNLKKARVVIIGGGELSGHIEEMIAWNDLDKTQFYHSYGMTET